jgi:hypothetical protein
MKEEKKTPEDIPETKLLAEVQLPSGIRLIGQIDNRPQNAVDGDGLRSVLRIYEYGVVTIRRGLRKAPIEGAAPIEVKVIQVTPLDFATGPISQTDLRDWEFIVPALILDKDSRDDMYKAYSNFLNRVPSTVEHRRASGEAP